MNTNVNDMNFLWSVLFLRFALFFPSHMTSISTQIEHVHSAHYDITHTISKSKIDERL